MAKSMWTSSTLTLTLDWCFNSFQKMLDGVEIRALCKSRPKSEYFFFLFNGPHFVHGGTVKLKEERAFPKLWPKSWMHIVF